MSVLHFALSPLTRGVPDPQRRLLRAAGLGVALALAAGVALVGFDAGLGLTVTGYGLGVGLALGLMRRGYPHSTLGLATSSRLALARALLAPLDRGAAVHWARYFAIALAPVV